MRGFKFRAWDKYQKVMYVSPDEIEHLGSWFDAHLPGAAADKNRIILMQFTGLTDKNGREIYEGDLLVDGLTRQGKYRTLDVYWNKVGIGGWWFGENGIPAKNIQWDRLSKVGNRFENPELLSEWERLMPPLPRRRERKHNDPPSLPAF